MKRLCPECETIHKDDEPCANVYGMGEQPCADYRPKEADIMAEPGHGIANVHECFGGCDGGMVSFCENCSFDHHAGGWGKCPRTFGR